MNETENKTIEETQTGPRWGRIIAWSALLLLLFIVGLGLIRAQEGPVGVGKTRPAFELTTFDDEIFSSESLLGKVVVLNFWASWCIPCEQEADELEAAAQYYAGRDDVIFLGVAWSDMDTKAKEYLTEFAITYPNGPDLGTRISQAFRLRGVPETYVIGKDGVLTHVQIGPFTSVLQITDAVEAALTTTH
jgi:cytochrome c biogenesis protein CcmG, thiol:disulfide interchange protein DsbE